VAIEHRSAYPTAAGRPCCDGECDEGLELVGWVVTHRNEGQTGGLGRGCLSPQTGEIGPAESKPYFHSDIRGAVLGLCRVDRPEDPCGSDRKLEALGAEW
jgi:hypothetical protein